MRVKWSNEIVRPASEIIKTFDQLGNTVANSQTLDLTRRLLEFALILFF